MKFSSSNVIPVITFAASLARGTPMDLLTKGMVRDARGLTSSIYTWSSLTANCMFISPLTFNSKAKSLVWHSISPNTFLLKERGGRQHALSPECTPASSICSIIPPMTTFLPSHIASTSNSVASLRNLSIKIGCSPEASIASSTQAFSDCWS